MIFLFTGTPGAGKSLNAIKFVDTDPTFKDRPVYYFNIKDCQLNWNELDEDGAQSWFDLPDGAVIILDEAYDLFPSRLTGKPPLHVEKLATHRHKGHDIILICQKVKGQIDSFVRGLIGRHIHLERRFGTKFVTQYEWQKCCEDVNNWHDRKAASTKQITLDKKYFEAYKSAEVHTVQPNLPWIPILAVPLLVLFVIGTLWYGYSNFFAESDSSVPASSSNSTGAMFAMTDNSDSMTTEQWFSAHTPRVDGLPHTAPIYDEVTKPVTFPNPQCVLWVKGNTCQCYSQQATKMDVPQELCLSLVKNGWFDSTKEDIEGEGKARRAAVSQPTSSPPSHLPKRFVLIKHNPPKRSLSIH
ncbi:MAG: zonular occludens toxin domain-containing protein [Porticoccus sp.]|nr:zonular occludens toxin domain-containing protein [Porticoccus sp.]